MFILDKLLVPWGCGISDSLEEIPEPHLPSCKPRESSPSHQQWFSPPPGAAAATPGVCHLHAARIRLLSWEGRRRSAGGKEPAALSQHGALKILQTARCSGPHFWCYNWRS